MKLRQKAALLGATLLSVGLLTATTANAAETSQIKQDLLTSSDIPMYLTGATPHAIFDHDHSRNLLAEVNELTEKGAPLNVLVSAKHGTILDYKIIESTQ